MAGINVPLQPVKHQYIITEKIAGLAPRRADAARSRPPHLLQGGGRRPGDGRLRARSASVDRAATCRADFEFRLFDDDWDHFEQHMTQAIARVPALETAGVKQMINGPESFTPRRQLHPRRARPSAPTCMSAPASTPSASPRAAAPAGLWRNGSSTARRRWICGPSTSGASPRCTATANGWSARTLEAYGKHYTVAFPHEEMRERPPAHRLAALRTAEGARRRVRLQARLGAAQLVRAARGVEPRDIYSMGRQNWFAAVGDEHRAVREKSRRLRPVLLRQIRAGRPRRGAAR